MKQMTVKYGEHHIIFKGLKKECESMVEHFDFKILKLSQHQRTLSGILGGEEHKSTGWVMFGKQQVRDEEGMKIKCEELAADMDFRTAGEITLKEYNEKFAKRISEIFEAHVCIVDERKTPEQIEQREQKHKEAEQAKHAANEVIAEMINIRGTEKVKLPEGKMFITLEAHFDDSDAMSDYFARHASLSPEFILAIVPDGKRREDTVRNVIAQIPELAALTWEWHTENYSMGHGTYLQSEAVGKVAKEAYNGRKEVYYHFEITFSHQTELTKSRHFVELQPRTDTGERKEQASTATGTVQLNEAKGGIEISFPGKPDYAILEKLKANGWRWSRFGKVWYIKFTESRLKFANELIGTNVDGGTKEPDGSFNLDAMLEGDGAQTYEQYQDSRG